MSDEREQQENASGCEIGVGLIIASIAVGAMYGASIGWLTFGSGLIVTGLLGWGARVWLELKGKL